MVRSTSSIVQVGLHKITPNQKGYIAGTALTLGLQAYLQPEISLVSVHQLYSLGHTIQNSAF